MSGSHTYSCIAVTQNERFGIYGVSEKKECNNHISEMGKYEICIPKSRILVQRIIRRHHKQLKWTTLKIQQNYQIKAIFLPEKAKNGFV